MELFPDPAQQTTAWTFLMEGQGKDDDATIRVRCLEYLAQRYWTPVFAFIRHKGYTETQAQDLTQEYFCVFLEKRYLDQAKRDRGRFRSFLFTSVKNFLSNQRGYENAKKRRPEGRVIPLHCSRETAVTGMLPIPDQADTAEETFMREWARSVMALAVKEMEAQCREKQLQGYWDVFRRHVVDSKKFAEPSYADTAKELEWDTEKVKRTLHRAKDKFAQAVREVLRESVQSDEEVDSELADLRRYF